MDIFDTKAIKPMLIAEMEDPFNDPNWIYEIKLDGIRCIAYLDSDTVDLRNKRDIKMLSWLPELRQINQRVKCKCILDGEVYVLENGITDFYEVQRRSVLTDPFKIQLAAGRYPAAFCAYDIIYYQDHLVTDMPLGERKKLLADTIKSEDATFSNSRFIVERGIELFDLVKQQNLEGVVAKKKSSKYWFDKRTKEWIKFKVMKTEDCVVCGYISKAGGMTSLIIGQYDPNGKMVYKGHVTLGVSLRKLGNYQITDKSPFDVIPEGNNHAVWLVPELVCIIEYMPSDKEGYRQATFKGVRDDKISSECRIIEF